MPTIIDALLVTLGLDDKNYTKGLDNAKKKKKEATDAINRDNALTERRERTTDNERTKRERAREKQAKAQAKLDRDHAREREKQAKERDKQAKAAGENIKKVRNQAIALFAIFTAGKGLKDFITDAVNGAAHLGLLSSNLGISTEQLNAWQRASERAGGTAEGMAAQLKESADAIAKYKLGQGMSEGMAKFFQFGGDDADLKSAESYLLARSKIVAKFYAQDPTKGALIASQMGISDEQLGLIKQGSSAVLALVDAQRKNSTVSSEDAAKALALRNRWLDFRDAIQATALRVLVALIPAFTRLADWLVKWADRIEGNRDVLAKWASTIADKVLPLLERFAKFMTDGGGWTAFVVGAKATAQAVIDIADALKEAIRLYREWTGAGPTLPGVTRVGPVRFGTTEDINADAMARGQPPTSRQHPSSPFLAKVSDTIEMAFARTAAVFGVKSAQEFIRDRTGLDQYNVGPAKVTSVPDKLMKMGWTQAQAAGITASFDQESGMDPAARNPKSGAYGIGQWLGPRVADFKKWAGKDLVGSSLDEQLSFFQHEVTQGKEKPAGDHLRAAKTASEAARIHAKEYERPGIEEANIARRESLANALDAAMRARNAKAVLAVPAGAAASVPASVNGAQPVKPNVSTSKTDVKIGQINVQTQATDATAIARDIGNAVELNGLVAQANMGMS